MECHAEEAIIEIETREGSETEDKRRQQNTERIQKRSQITRSEIQKKNEERLKRKLGIQKQRW